MLFKLLCPLLVFILPWLLALPSLSSSAPRNIAVKADFTEE